MKKKFIRVMFSGALALATFPYVGCRDYDGDIDQLEQKIAKSANAITEINKLVEEGPMITKVESITGGVEVALSNGKSFTVRNGDAGKDGTQRTINEDGYWCQDGKKTEFKAGGDKGGPDTPGEPGTPGKNGNTYIPGEDEFWYKNEVKPENETDKTWIVPGVVSAVDMGDYYIFNNLRNETNEATSATVYKYSATSASSLVRVPLDISKDLGDIIFLPIIAYDNSSKNTAAYEYNSGNRPLYRTLVNGWAEYEYKLSPASVNPQYYTGISSVEQTATTITRTTKVGLPLAKVATTTDHGRLIVKTSAGDNANNPNAFKMYKGDSEQGTTYDNPDGKPMKESTKYGKAGKMNMLAYMVKNTDEQLSETTNINVIFDYVVTKCMVVGQEGTTIGFTVDADKYVDPTVKAPVLPSLSDVYKKAETRVNDYLASLPVNLKFLYTADPLDLEPLLAGLATKFHTNTGFDIDENQYILTGLDFENVIFQYEAVSYMDAEVDQTKHYLKLGGSEISVIDKQSTSIGHQTVLEVKMYVNGKSAMSKLMKIEFVEQEQQTKDFVNIDLKEQTLACTALYGGSAELTAATVYQAATVVEDLKMDFDRYFDALQVSKTKFVEYYGGGNPIVEVMRDGVKFDGWSSDSEEAGKNLTVDYSNIEGSAITDSNNVYFGLENQLRVGTYVIEFTYSTANTAPTYKAFTITATSVVKDPVHTWTYNPSMWEGTEYMLGYGQPASGDYDAPFLMKTTIEDGFMDPWDGCGQWDLKLIITAPTGEMTLTINIATNRYVLNIFDRKWMGEKIRVRAIEYTETKDAAKNNRKINDIVSATKTSEFNIMFVNPVVYAQVNATAAWYLVDKANTIILKGGAYLPIYRFIKLYDIKGGETNGMVFDGSQREPWFEGNEVEIGKDLFKMHKVEVSYKLSDKNDAIIQRHASILKSTDGKEVGLLRWNNNESVLVDDVDQPIIIDVTIRNSWMGQSERITTQTQEVTVCVKKADTKYTVPATGLLGTLATPEGLNSCADLD